MKNTDLMHYYHFPYDIRYKCNYYFGNTLYDS